MRKTGRIGLLGAALGAMLHLAAAQASPLVLEAPSDRDVAALLDARAAVSAFTAQGLARADQGLRIGLAPAGGGAVGERVLWGDGSVAPVPFALGHSGDRLFLALGGGATLELATPLAGATDLLLLRAGFSGQLSLLLTDLVLGACDGSVRPDGAGALLCDGSVIPAPIQACDGSVLPNPGALVACDGSVRPSALAAVLGDGSVRAGDGSVRTALLTNLAGNFLLGGFITLACDGSVVPAGPLLCDGSVFPADATLFLQIGGYASPIPAPASFALLGLGLLGMAAVRGRRPARR